MKPYALVVAVVAFWVSSLLPSRADAAVDGAEWVCWYEAGELAIRCRLSGVPNDADGSRAARARERVDARLPELVRTIRGNPERLTGRDIRIPLWSDPTDMDYAGLLAESVMCGSETACSASFDANADGQASLRIAALVATDPEEFIAAVGREMEGFERFQLARWAASGSDKSGTRRRGARRA